MYTVACQYQLNISYPPYQKKFMDSYYTGPPGTSHTNSLIRIGYQNVRILMLCSYLSCVTRLRDGTCICSMSKDFCSKALLWIYVYIRNIYTFNKLQLMLVPFVIFVVLALVLVLVVVSYSFFIVLMRGMAIFDNNNS